MKIRLKVEQQYISLNGAILFGKKGETVDVDPTFVKHISGKFDFVGGVEEEPKEEKPLAKMTKDELIAKAKTLGIDLGEAFEEMTKADIIRAINEVINK